MMYCLSNKKIAPNIVQFSVSEGDHVADPSSVSFFSASVTCSCGMAGKSFLDDLNSGLYMIRLFAWIAVKNCSVYDWFNLMDVRQFQEEEVF